MSNNWRETEWQQRPPHGVWLLSKLVRSFEQLNCFVGRTLAWLTAVMAVVMLAIVVARYGFNIGSIKAQESVIYMHSLVFMLCSAYCLYKGKQVKIDIFYARMSPRRQVWIDLLGTVFFLLPMASFFFYISLDYVLASWGYLEKSPDPAGLPYIYLLKTLLLIMPVLLFMQGLADLLRSFCYLRGWLHYREPPAPIMSDY